MMRSGWFTLLALAVTGLGSVPAAAQMTTIDPNTAIDSDLKSPPQRQQPQQSAPPPATTQMQESYPPADTAPPPVDSPPPPVQTAPASPVAADPSATTARQAATDTFEKDDLLAAAEGTFGKGASGLAKLLEDILKDQGKPNAYIAGSEASGAIGVGLRYGKGQMFHKVEGQRPIYWTGPSIGFDLGGDANKVFVLVYNLYDSQEIYKRFPQGEGHAYLVGGFSASYLRRGDVVLIPVRLGVGWRLGVNAGYMKFSEKQRWLPF
ncbi:hypothetical protein SAMN03159338_3629 [Sphingomonas sp. NFR04]|uniref:DUF1134 domain-containing protein n=1 Tax=Sphingomonas sp. NFR04 TaxID=1566283 RepID=UPI0008E3CE99|nr:DUF1134 domain-containing protein [Sphingomonas sp. NFR04]SFK23482.1 hypothetical protein SAMN03159338_3629 [Sphingomonas sp. NFR04]